MIISAFIISLKVVVVGVSISVILAIISNYILIERSGKFRSIIEIIIIFPMFLPPSAIGYIILILIGKNGFIGKIIYENFGYSIIFTWTAAVIVGIIVSLPLIYQSIKIQLQGIDKEMKWVAAEMGASKIKIYRKISLPLCKKGIMTGIILGIARVFGEFGATILVAGNIPGETQTVPMALYYAIENDNKEIAMIILSVIVFISIILTLSYNFILKRMK